MARKRPSVQKRQREYQKRQRELDKAAKATQKRERRRNGEDPGGPQPTGDEGVPRGSDDGVSGPGE